MITLLTRWMVVGLVLTAACIPASAATDFLLDIEGVEGEAPIRDIELLSWSWGVSNPGATRREAGSGLATGRRQHKPLHIVKTVDKGSPLLLAVPALFRYCATGKHIAKATLRMFSTDDNGQRTHIMTVELTDVVIASGDVDGDGAADRTAGSGGGAGKATFQDFHFTMTYDTITITDVVGKSSFTDTWK
jgi:type VI secretion system secreted protein Hcp